jgi:hypothetical protein
VSQNTDILAENLNLVFVKTDCQIAKFPAGIGTYLSIAWMEAVFVISHP